MSSITLKPAFMRGEITVPSSKSVAHRALITAALSKRVVRITNVNSSSDIKATIDALIQLGVNIICEDDCITVDGRNILENSDVKINANESGSTLRFIIPVTVMLGNNAVFDGNGRLPIRPLDDYFNIFDKYNFDYTHPEGKNLPLITRGKLDADVFEVRGDVSSQFITGLLLCGMIRPVKIRITTRLESKPYVDITVDVLRKFGCKVTVMDNVYEVCNGESDISEFSVESDWSQAAFFVCAGAINGEVKINNINLDSLQGDKAVLSIAREFGVEITEENNSVTIHKSAMNGVEIDASDIPDLVPVLSVLASYANGRTKIYNASRLRLKESDRIKTTYDELTALGADIEMGSDYMIINGGKRLHGGVVNSHNDHRIVMSMAVASLGCEDDVTINGYKAIDKSYPDFFDDWSEMCE